MKRRKLITKERQKGVGIYITNPTYEAWLDNLSIKELTLALYPPTPTEFNSVGVGSRSDYLLKVIKMPVWWVDWYRSLDKEDKFRFARLIEKRLRSIGLVGGVL
jgi:hypothetical protein